MYMARLRKPEFRTKHIMFWQKMAIFIDPKNFKSGLADRAHRACHIEVSSPL